jgi:general secretion pathway protein H
MAMTPTSRVGDRLMPTTPVSQRGYTLLELLVVLAVLALVSAIATGYVPTDRGSQRVKLEADRLETDLRSARSTAIFRGETVAFTVDVAQGSWRYDGKASHAVPRQIRLTLFTGRQLQNGDAVGAIQFFPSGASSGGHVIMLSEGHTAQIDVDWLTGRIHQHLPDDRR